MEYAATVLFVDEINTSRRFYEDILGQQIEHDFGKNIMFKSGVSLWELRDDHMIARKLSQNKNIHNLEIYFETSNLDEFKQNLDKHQLDYFHEIHEEIWGQRTVRFFDPDGHLIEVGETLRSFVTRIYKKEKSVEMVSEKTFIPIDQVKGILKID